MDGGRAPRPQGRGTAAEKGPSSSKCAPVRTNAVSKRSRLCRDLSALESADWTIVAPSYTPITRKPLPSAKLQVATADVFAKPKDGSTPFSIAYAAGNIPCRINHGGVRHQLQWSRPPASLPLDPLLVLCAEGLRETVHPHNFVAPSAFFELCQCEGSAAQIFPLLHQLQTPIRMALMSKDKNVFLNANKAVRALVEVVGPALIDCVGPWLVPLGKGNFLDTALRSEARDTLCRLEDFGGPSVRALIRSKVPSHTSIR